MLAHPNERARPTLKPYVGPFLRPNDFRPHAIHIKIMLQQTHNHFTVCKHTRHDKGSFTNDTSCTVKFFILSLPLSVFFFQRTASSSRATDWAMDLIQMHLPAFMWHFDYGTSVPSRKQTRTRPNYLPAPHGRIFHVGNFTCKGFLGW
jgi:hypothetical protein